MAQTKTDKWLENLLLRNKNELFQQVLANKDKHRLQIIYTQIDRDRNNKPTFKNHYFNLNKDVYHNPASTVKLPLAIFSLEKINELKIKGVNKFTTITFDKSFEWQTADTIDKSAESGKPSIAQYIRRVLLVSENEPYNRLYQFIGQKEINQKLKKYGFDNSMISRQFLGLTPEQNAITNGCKFLDEKGLVIYKQEPLKNDVPLDFSKIIKVGKGYYKGKTLVDEPFDFSAANRFSLEDFQSMVQRIMFPEAFPKHLRFNLTADDYQFLRQYMSQYPAETNYPKYDEKHYYDSYVKYFFLDSTQAMPKHFRVFNKVGWAYGFLTDVSYIVDYKSNIEFMLSATIYCNEDEILNDDKYEYETVGLPFLKQLGKLVYEYDLKRNRKTKPNLENFRLNYEIRDKNDSRPIIKDVDN